MAEQVTLPRLGQGMESGTIVRWLKSEGDQVQKGEPLYELDTDKVTQEVEADVGGVLLKILVNEGEVPVGTPVAFLGEAGEDLPEVEAPAEPEAVSAGTGSEQAQRAPEQPDGTAPSEGAPELEAAAPEAVPADSGRIKASPLARRIARERGIDLASVSGTGPEGRIVAEDVERADVAGTAAGAGAGSRGGRGRARRADLAAQDGRRGG